MATGRPFFVGIDAAIRTRSMYPHTIAQERADKALSGLLFRETVVGLLATTKFCFLPGLAFCSPSLLSGLRPPFSRIARRGHGPNRKMIAIRDARGVNTHSGARRQTELGRGAPRTPTTSFAGRFHFLTRVTIYLVPSGIGMLSRQTRSNAYGRVCATLTSAGQRQTYRLFRSQGYNLTRRQLPLRYGRLVALQ